MAVRSRRPSGTSSSALASVWPLPWNQPIHEPTPCAAAASWMRSASRPSSNVSCTFRCGSPAITSTMASVARAARPARDREQVVHDRVGHRVGAELAHRAQPPQERNLLARDLGLSCHGSPHTLYYP